MGRRRPEEKTIAARRRFLSEGALPGADIPLPILRSWKRSAELGLHMGAKPEIHVLAAQQLREAQQQNETLCEPPGANWKPCSAMSVWPAILLS